jgi:hypothetical protein
MVGVADCIDPDGGGLGSSWFFSWLYFSFRILGEFSQAFMGQISDFLTRRLSIGII